MRQGVGANSAKALIMIIMVLLHFLIRKDQVMLLSPENDLVYEMALGSYGTRAMSLEFLVAVEQLQLVTAFMLKASVLIMYARMTNLSRLKLVVKTTAICVAVGFIIIEVLWLGVWCRPLKLYMEWPATNSESLPGSSCAPTLMIRDTVLYDVPPSHYHRRL
jgi:hypothetical protein